jgi:hypothetical protein
MYVIEQAVIRVQALVRGEPWDVGPIVAEAGRLVATPIWAGAHAPFESRLQGDG